MPFLIVLGPTEILVIAAIILLLFGGRKLPELFRGLGEGMREFKRGTQEAENASELPNSDEAGASDSSASPSGTNTA